MGKEFLDGYIILAEGEKDPRNLLLAFAIARVLLIEFETAAHIEVGRFMRVSSRISLICFTGFVQHHILLLSHHIPTTTR